MAADDEQLTAIAEQFASSMSDDFVSANPAIQADNELNATDARDFYIDPILNLARRMTPEQRLYLLIE